MVDPGFRRDAPTKGGPTKSRSTPLWKLPDEIPCSNGSDEHGPVRQKDDQLVQVLDLQRVIQCEANAVRRVKQQQRARHENRHARKWVAQHREHVLMTGGREPEREGEAEQQQQDRDHQGGHHAPGAEEKPQERLERYSLCHRYLHLARTIHATRRDVTTHRP